MPMVFDMFLLDGTLVSRNSMEPLCVCPSIFNRNIRNLPECWFVMGFVEPSSNLIGNLRKTKKVNGIKVPKSQARGITSFEKASMFAHPVKISSVTVKRIAKERFRTYNSSTASKREQWCGNICRRL